MHTMLVSKEHMRIQVQRTYLLFIQSIWKDSNPYLTRFPQGHYVESAQRKIEGLKKEIAQVRQEEDDRQAALLPEQRQERTEDAKATGRTDEKQVG